MPLSDANRGVLSSVMTPRSGFSRPAIMLTSEVFPAPEGPNKAVAPPAASKRTASRNAPSCFCTSTTSTDQPP